MALILFSGNPKLITDFYETQTNSTTIFNYPKKLTPKLNRTTFQDELVNQNSLKYCHGMYF